MKRGLWAAAIAAGLMAGSVAAETCGGTYQVKRGESLSLIADRLYKNASRWTAIHTNNIQAIGEDPNAIVVGQRLRLTCIDGLPTGLADGRPVEAAAQATASAETQVVARAPRRALEATINLVTAGDFAPFTDQSLPGEGLLSEVVHAAMQQSPASDAYRVHWVHDWSSHLDPLMTSAMMDMAFPWYKPDCAGDPSQYRCENFHFSKPMFEMLILLFVNTDRPIPFSSDSDMHGRTLCRPAGYFTHDLDRAGRRWISDGLVKLEQPRTVKDCFDMLVAGTVDGVALNEFTGRAAVKELALEGQVDVVQGRPISIEGLHVLVHKTHPDAEALLAMINDGMGAIQANGQYQTIVDAHMSRIWSEF